MISTANSLQGQSGEVAMTRLADRLATLSPPPLDLSPNMIVRPAPSAAVRAALATSAAIAKRADERARRSRSIVRMTVESFVSACQFISYGVVALALRGLMAHSFFFDGQGLIAGPRYLIDLPSVKLAGLNLTGFNFSVVLPAQIKAEAIAALTAAHPLVPVPAVVTGTLLGYAEFLLPIMLLIGFGTRFAALGLLAATALIQLYAPLETLWSVHIFWAAILAVLVSQGPGKMSVDHLVRLIAKR
jgi:putative oxidoreductase